MSESELQRIVQSLQSLNVQYMLIVKEEQVAVWALDAFPRNHRKHIKDIVGDDDESHNPAVLDIRPFLTTQKTLHLAKFRPQDLDLLRQYEIILNSLTQNVCKTLAKEWIKLIEPRKQATFPYKSDVTPAWWPAGVPHVEPDHLEKRSRIRLLIAIIRLEHVDIVSLKRAANTIVSASEYTHHLLYELFYIALYERFFFGYGRAANDDLWWELDDNERIWLDKHNMSLPVSDLARANKTAVSRTAVNKAPMHNSTFSNPVVVRQFAADHFNTETVSLWECFSVDDFSPGDTPESEELLLFVSDSEIKLEFPNNAQLTSEFDFAYDQIMREHDPHLHKRIRLASPALRVDLSNTNVSDSSMSKFSDFELSLVCSSATSDS